MDGAALIWTALILLANNVELADRPWPAGAGRTLATWLWLVCGDEGIPVECNWGSRRPEPRILQHLLLHYVALEAKDKEGCTLISPYLLYLHVEVTKFAEKLGNLAGGSWVAYD